MTTDTLLMELYEQSPPRYYQADASVNAFGYVASVASKMRTVADLIRRGEWFQITTRLNQMLVPSCVAVLDGMCLFAHHSVPSALPEPPRGCVFSQASLENLHDVLLCSGHTDNQKANRLFRQFEAAGNRCYIAKCGGNVLAYCWVFRHNYIVTFDSYENTVIDVPLGPNIFAVGNVFVHPDARQRGVGAALMNNVIGQLNAKSPGMTLLSFVRPSNEASIRLHYKLKFSILSRYYYFVLPLGRFLIVRTPSEKTRLYRLTKNHKIAPPPHLK